MCFPAFTQSMTAFLVIFLVFQLAILRKIVIRFLYFSLPLPETGNFWMLLIYPNSIFPPFFPQNGGAVSTKMRLVQYYIRYVKWPIWPPCPYMVKNLKKSSSLEPKGQWPWKLICSIGYSSTSKFVRMMTLSWHWPILWQGQIWSLMLLYAEKGKIMAFSETIVVCDIKVSRFSLLFNEYMNYYEYQWSRSFIELHPRSLRFNIFNLLLLRNR